MNCNKNALSTQATVTPFGTHRYESQLMEQISWVHGQALQEKAVGLPDNLFQCCQQQHSCLINTHKDKILGGPGGHGPNIPEHVCS